MNTTTLILSIICALESILILYLFVSRKPPKISNKDIILYLYTDKIDQDVIEKRTNGKVRGKVKSTRV
jgi:hypothetical protein